MMNKLSIPAKEEQDLHIAKHIEPETLPAIIQPVMALAQTDAEKDMLLLALLTAAGSCMPNLYFRYGLTGKKYFPNLQCFIVGSAACGKGIANLALELVSKVHEAQPLVIAGDSSYPGFYRQLAKQNGRGYIHESEGSVITDVWRSSVANYNTALRKAAEHEPVTRNRANNSSVIACPQLSVLLTGTFSQYKALVPSIENGYFSRLLTLIINDQQAFSHRYVEPGSGRNGVMRVAAEQLYGLYEHLYFCKPVEFALTADQRTRLGQHLENAYPMLMQLLGQNFHSVVLRMAVQIERIAMILSALRFCSPRYSEDSLSSFTGESDSPLSPSVSPELNSGTLSHRSSEDSLSSFTGESDSPLSPSVSPELNSGTFLCSDTDYATAELIGNKLLLHMASAYRLINGAEQPSVPAVQPLDQRQMLLSLLPSEFESRLLIAEAKSQGIPQSTVMRWCAQWIDRGVLFRTSYGHYKKTA